VSTGTIHTLPNASNSPRAFYPLVQWSTSEGRSKNFTYCYICDHPRLFLVKRSTDLKEVKIVISQSLRHWFRFLHLILLFRLLFVCFICAPHAIPALFITFFHQRYFSNAVCSIQSGFRHSAHREKYNDLPSIFTATRLQAPAHPQSSRRYPRYLGVWRDT